MVKPMIFLERSRGHVNAFETIYSIGLVGKSPIVSPIFVLDLCSPHESDMPRPNVSGALRLGVRLETAGVHGDDEFA